MVEPLAESAGAAGFDVVTGAFSYTGKYIAQRLLSQGHRVRTLTGHPNLPSPFGDRVEAVPFSFDNRSQLVDSLRGASTLYNTYWIRFPRREVTFARAVENTGTLINAAGEAGVRRLVHISITNPSLDSPLPYFRGKALVERAIEDSGLSFAVIRPAVIFGPEDVLLSNIAWFLRRFPLFPIAGSGDYPIQPVFVEDVAALAVAAGKAEDNTVQDAVGPETYSFQQLVSLIAEKVRSKAKLAHVPPGVALGLARLMSLLVKDVVLTKEEIKGLMHGLLVSREPATANTLLSQWLDQNRETLGMNYASELRRHYR